MNALFFGSLAVAVYAIGFAHQTLIFRNKIKKSAFLTFLLGAIALVSQSIMTYSLISTENGLNFSFFNASSLFAILINLLVIALVPTKPVQNLTFATYPIAILATLSALVFSAPEHVTNIDSIGLLAHITFSILAYSVFTLAAVQAALLYTQNQALKTNYNSLLIRNLPPLQTMENMLFEMIWTGTTLLTLAIVNGVIFIDDLFAQHLAHKTAFSIFAWATFATLLIGHKWKGWRGFTASRWTLGGCFLLMLAYFGSKFAIEFVVT